MSNSEKRISSMINKLTQIALSDEKITQDEANIINSVQINVVKYDQALEEALVDGIIDEDEKNNLDRLKNKIISDASSMAQVSDGVSNEELKLLEIILKKLV